MTANIYTQLIGAICLLNRIVPDYIILTALARPNRQLHRLHTLGRADIRHHHIETLGSLVFNVNGTCHAVFRFFYFGCCAGYPLQATIWLNVIHVNIIFTAIIFMTADIYTQLIDAICLLNCIVPDYIILTALTRPNRQLHRLHTLGRADIRYHHIETLGSLVFNVNRTCHLTLSWSLRCRLS